MNSKLLALVAVGGSLVAGPPPATAQSAASLLPARERQCGAPRSDCSEYDAIVFVHGIYGSAETFRNGSTGFEWPKQMPMQIQQRSVDVFVLEYQTAMFAWAAGRNPDFKTVSKAVYAAMEPLRKRKYRSIGFIAHSLGGNVVSTYIHSVKTSLGHPQRSINAYTITLATPVLGAQIADIAGALKAVLKMKDPLLASLTKDNLYLTMLSEFREEEGPKGERFGCRPVHLHAAYEEKYLGPVLVVSTESAALSVSKMAASPVVGFKLDHSEIAKPRGVSDPLYRWVVDRVEGEFARLGDWETSASKRDAKFRLCATIPFVDES